MPINARDAKAVVPDSSDSARNVCGVRFRQDRSRAWIDEAISMKIARDPRDRSRGGIGPDVCLKIWMADVDAFVDYADHHTSASLCCIPRLWRADLCQSVERIKLGIVGSRRINVDDIVRFGIDNIIASLQRSDRFHRVVRSHACES